VHVILLTEGSRLIDEARDLHAAGRARLVEISAHRDTPFEDVQPADCALVGTSVPPFFLHHLLHRCTHGALANVGLVEDGPSVDADRIGYRWGPWLDAVYLPAGNAFVPQLYPAPVRLYDRLGDLVSRPCAPPVQFTEVPGAFPGRLQIQTTSRCVRGCSYCPKPRQQLADQLMDRALFDRIVDECADHGPASLELYLHAEPLEDLRMEALADRAKGACPATLVSIATHERSLDVERTRSLAGSGLDVVFVSVNAAGATTEAVLRRRLGSLVEPARILARQDKRLVVTTLTNLLPEGQRGLVRRLCRELGLAQEAYRATSRVGDARLRPHVRVLPSSEGCLRPFTTAHVLADGRVTACCEDWQYRRIFGTLRDTSLARIWTGVEARTLRRELLSASPTDPCDHCDILPRRGTLSTRGERT